MIKTIIATSDWHVRPLKKHDEYKPVFNELISHIKDEKPDRVVIAGDLFHSKLTISNESSILMSTVLNAIAKYSKIIIIPGNHDSIIGGSRVDSITPIIEIMNNENIVYYKDSGCYVDKWDSDVVYCVWSCLEHQKSPNIKEFKDQYDTKGEKIYIGLYHGVIEGSKTDTGFSLENGIDTADFYHTDFFIAGDIHKHQTYNYINYKNGGFGVMIGSLIQQNFGESLENHGYIFFQLEKSEWTYKLIELDNENDYHNIVLTNYEDLENI